MIAEKCMLVAVRNQLRSVGGWTDQQCDIEFDEEVPAIAGDTYIAVIPGGWSAGPRQNTCGNVADSVYSLDVTVIKRIRHVPRDRRRDVFLNNVGALDKEIQLVHAALDWQYTVLNAANMLLAADADAPSMVGFCEPLRMTSVQRRPRLVNPDMFGAGQTQAAGMARTITFGGARRVSAIQRIGENPWHFHT